MVLRLVSDSSLLHSRSWRWWLLPVAAAVVVLLALDQSAHIWAEQRALAGLRSEAEATASQRVAVLQSEIEKQRALPFVLAQDPDVRQALSRPNAATIDPLNRKLATLAAGTRAGVIYLLDITGLTIAASNYETPISFVGNNYAFRPYYQLAMANGGAEAFAFGTVSQQPGLYLSRRIDATSGPLGVIVVKVEFQEIEAEWHRFAERVFVLDDRGIVLVTSEATWRFMSTVPLSSEQQDSIRASLQFGNAPLNLLPVHPKGGRPGMVSVQPPRAKAPIDFIEVAAAVPTTTWTLHLLTPTHAAITIATTAARALALLGGVFSLGVIALWWIRRRSQQQQRIQAENTRRELEDRVRDRTAELEDANTRLRSEMTERQRAQTVLNQLQDELVQANKLTVLGQIAASVAHEINQPVAAIRTFADNGATLLARNDLQQTRDNLARIASLTDRIGSITGELRAFARKSPSKVEAVSLQSTIDGALLLVGHRLRQQAIGFELTIAGGDIIIAADRIRLEQVFVNLLQNAIEALTGHLEPRIRIDAVSTDDRVSITVSDNGPGLPDTVMQSLFVPFTTTKATGLGLGLVISKDIVSELGGSFSGSNAAIGGAIFTVTLPRFA
ncbi:sensor histidine kinase [Bradyrhizobium prioriisuperbiae]|uniref:sensor histidine kinase n=1 Tax=Bradyrhizobium prioriisuperbiae TaxID=2854389 RepID=UPI0028ECA979|nr:ATP-binding protein [Bradyrhizobium prioritasuperba]